MIDNRGLIFNGTLGVCFWRQDKCDRKKITNYETGTETKHIHCAYKDKTLSVLERG